MTYAAGQPSWSGLTTRTPEQTQAFYSALFGWQYWHMGEHYGHYAMAHQQGRSAAGIFPAPAAGAPSAWTVYFASDDLAADIVRIDELGGQLVVGPHQIGDQGHMALFTDPLGVGFGLWQAGDHRGAESRDDHGSVIWVEHNTRDAARALEFYTTLLRAESTPVAGMDYHQLGHGDRTYAGISGMGDNWDVVTPTQWMTYRYTPDVDETARLAEQHGGRVLVAPFDMPYGRMAVLADPSGATFSVMNPGTAGQG